MSLNEKENCEITQQCVSVVSSLSTKLDRHTVRHGDPIVFKMENFSVFGKTKTYDFYFYRGGHKFRFHVHPNGIGHAKGSYMSLALEIIDGEYDDILIESFTDSVSVKLLNQKYDNDHYSHTFKFTRIQKHTAIYRFCAHDELEDYVKNGKVYFKLECSVNDKADKSVLAV